MWRSMLYCTYTLQSEVRKKCDFALLGEGRAHSAPLAERRNEKRRLQGSYKLIAMQRAGLLKSIWRYRIRKLYLPNLAVPIHPDS